MIKTSDNKNELFDIVDENDKVISQATRGEVHGNPKLMHRSVGVVIFNSYGEIFLQQRSAGKDMDPNKWTISCSGHVTKNTFISERSKIKSFRHPDSASDAEKDLEYLVSSTVGGARVRRGHPRGVLRHIYEEAAHRELKEELGVDLEIIPVCKFIYRSETETEMVMLFQAKSDGPFKLNKEEIVQGKFFTRNKLNSLVKFRQIDISKWGKMVLEKISWL